MRPIPDIFSRLRAAFAGAVKGWNKKDDMPTWEQSLKDTVYIDEIPTDVKPTTIILERAEESLTDVSAENESDFPIDPIGLFKLQRVPESEQISPGHHRVVLRDSFGDASEWDDGLPLDAINLAIAARDMLPNGGIIVNTGTKAQQEPFDINIVDFSEAHQKTNANFMMAYAVELEPSKDDLKRHEGHRRVLAKTGDEPAVWLESAVQAGTRGHMVVLTKSAAPEDFGISQDKSFVLKKYLRTGEPIIGWSIISEGYELHALPRFITEKPKIDPTEFMSILSGRKQPGPKVA